VGVSWEYEISILGMGFMIIGHQAHHLNVIEERYWPVARKRLIFDMTLSVFHAGWSLCRGVKE